MARTLLRDPEVDKWVPLFIGPGILRYLHVLNADRVAGANIALGIQDTSIPELPKPASGSVTPTGATGSMLYEYYVTAVNEDGETDPLPVGTIANGVLSLDGDTNYHTISWDPVSGATSYVVYVRENNLTWRRKLATSGPSAVNDGTWDLAYAPPWLNMTTITCLLDYERIGASALLQSAFDAELTSGERLVFATTNSLVNVATRYLEVV